MQIRKVPHYSDLGPEGRKWWVIEAAAFSEHNACSPEEADYIDAVRQLAQTIKQESSTCSSQFRELKWFGLLVDKTHVCTKMGSHSGQAHYDSFSGCWWYDDDDYDG